MTSEAARWREEQVRIEALMEQIRKSYESQFQTLIDKNRRILSARRYTPQEIRARARSAYFKAYQKVLREQYCALKPHADAWRRLDVQIKEYEWRQRSDALKRNAAIRAVASYV